MEERNIAGPLKWLEIAFVGYIFAWILMITGSTMGADEDTGGIVLLIGVAALLLSALTYLICLGKVAARTGRSWITWVGLTVITSPFGYLVAYGMIKSKVEKNPKLQPAP